jgi:tetratricopeptide (TPR) repeat protein
MRHLAPEHATKQLAYSILFLLTILVYLPSVGGDFLWDDETYIKTNPLLTNFEGLYHIWFNLRANPQYYPLTFTTFWIEFQIWDLWPGGYHLVNIFLHAMNALLLWRVLSNLAIPGAWIAAAIFAIHPVHVDSVAQISERKNVLSMFFYLAALLTYLRFSPLDHSAEDHVPRSQSLYIGVVLLLLCALLSKTTACSLPAVILLLIWWKKERIDWRHDIIPLFPLFGLSLFMSGITVFVEHEITGATGHQWDRSILEKTLIAGQAFWIYVIKLFWPVDLQFMYPKWEVISSDPWQYFFPILSFLVLVLTFLMRDRIGKAPAVALFCFVGNLLPALGFFNLYFMRYSFVADHFQYLASISLIALSISIIWRDFDCTFDRALRSYSQSGTTIIKDFFHIAPYRTLLTCVILLSLGALSWNHESLYANRETIWNETLKRDPESLVAHNNLGNIFLERNEYKRALSHYQSVINFDPDFPEAQYNLALTLFRLGQSDEAFPHGQQAVQLKPDVSLFHSLLGSLFWTKGNTEQAIEHFRQATQLSPPIPQAHYNLGLLYLQTTPSPATVLVQEAIAQFERALALNPNSLQTQHTLAWTLATFPNASIRNGQRAVQLAEQACQRTQYQIPQLLDTLAAAYAESGQFLKAIQTAQTAAETAHDQQQEALANQITIRLELYKTNKPYRASLEQLYAFKMAG